MAGTAQKDPAEKRLWHKVELGEPRALSLVLKLLCKDRGYTEHPTAAPMGERQTIQLYWTESGEDGPNVFLPHKIGLEARDRVQAKLNQRARREDQGSVLPVPPTTPVVQEDPVDDAVAEATLSKLTDTLQQFVREREQSS